jgi:predicted outer membrane protein
MKNYLNCLLIMLAAGTATAQTTPTQNQSSSITAEQFVDQAALSGMKEVATGKMAKRKAKDTRVKDFGTMMAEDHGKANTELTALAKSKNMKLPKQGDIMPPSSTMDNSDDTAGSANTNGDAGTTATNSTTTGNANQTTSTTTGTTGTTTTSGTNGSATTSTNQSTTHQNHATGQINQSQGTNNMTDSGESLKMVNASDIRTAIQQLDGLADAQFDNAYTQMMIADHKNAIALFERGAMSSDSDIRAFATKHLPTLRRHLQEIQSISGANAAGQSPGQGSKTGSGNQ